MKIFLNDIPIRIIRIGKLSSPHAFSQIIGPTQVINPKLLVDNVLFKNPSAATVDELLHHMTQQKFKRVAMITFACEDKRMIVEHVKKQFKVVEAAGGIVEKNGKFLMIHRKKKWDLPKGKKEKRETLEDCAKREVEEETGVEVVVNEKIIHIWHTYMQNQKFILKKTHWFSMTCISDKKISPQTEEGISQVKWMTMNDMQTALVDSYRSLRYVVQEYEQKLVNP